MDSIKSISFEGILRVYNEVEFSNRVLLEIENILTVQNLSCEKFIYHLPDIPWKEKKQMPIEQYFLFCEYYEIV